MQTIDLTNHFSKEALQLHREFQRSYEKRLKDALSGTPAEGESLDKLVCSENTSEVTNLASQVWNETFVFNCMTAEGAGSPTTPVKEAVQKEFGSWEEFQEKFNTAAMNTVGSSYIWLVRDTTSNKLKILHTQGGECPLRMGTTPILCLDMCEHAYCLDFRTDLEKYVNCWWNSVNWTFVDENYSK